MPGGSRRLLFAFCTRCKYMETSWNLSKINPAMRSTYVARSRVRVMSDQWRVSVQMARLKNAMLNFERGSILFDKIPVSNLNLKMQRNNRSKGDSKLLRHLPFGTCGLPPVTLIKELQFKQQTSCHVFTRLFTSNTPWYFLDFAFKKCNTQFA